MGPDNPTPHNLTVNSAVNRILEAIQQLARHRAWQRWPFRWIRAQEPLVLLGAGALGVLLWAFVGITDEVVEGESHIADRLVLRMLRNSEDPSRPIGPRWLEHAAIDWTALGSAPVLTLLVAAVVGFMLLTRRWGPAALVLIATVSGALLVTLLKRGFSRPRPTVVPELTEHLNYSFPSGHATTAAVVYLTLAAIVCSVLTRKRDRAYVAGVAIAVTILVGLTRIYLGVHYPTDVAAGWCVGGSWAILCWVAARMMRTRWRRRRPVAEPEARQE